MKGKKHEHEEMKEAVEPQVVPAEEAQATPVASHPEAEDIQALREKAQKADEWHDKYLRMAADMENYRKRAQKDKQSAVEFAQVQIIQGLLPIVDNLERGLAQITNQPAAKSVREGLELISKQIHAFLESIGLKTFNSVGETFDPHKHEAVLHVPSKDHPDHSVIEEIQKGYILNGRVIRHAMVKVADNPANVEKKE